jgi:hypothetical protein
MIGDDLPGPVETAATPGDTRHSLLGTGCPTLRYDPTGEQRRTAVLEAEVVHPPRRNPPDGPGRRAHRELWLRDPDGYLVVLASPDGESPWPDPRVD